MGYTVSALNLYSFPKKAYAFTSHLTLSTNPVSRNLDESTVEDALFSLSKHGSLEDANYLIEKLFSLSTLGLRHRESSCISTVFPTSFFECGKLDSDDVVLHPLIGFRWVALNCLNENQFIIIPSSSPMSLPILSPNKNEETVGWWCSPSRALKEEAFF